jgi:hypothetical protein
MNQEEVTLASLLSRLQQSLEEDRRERQRMMEIMLTIAESRAGVDTIPPPRPPPDPPQTTIPDGPASGPDIDTEHHIDSSDSRGSLSRRRSSILPQLNDISSPARHQSNTSAPSRTTQPQSNNTPSVQLVATEIKIEDEKKISVATIKSIRHMQKLYRAHQKEHPHSKRNLSDFVQLDLLKKVRANEYALGTDLAYSLVSAEDLKDVSDNTLIGAFARLYRTTHIENPGNVATRLFKEVPQVKWPSEYYNARTKTWAINPAGFHQHMYAKTLEHTRALAESVEFMFKGASKDELTDLLPPLTWGSRHKPGAFQFMMKCMGEMSDSLTTLITENRLLLVKSAQELEGLINGVLTDYAEQGRMLAKGKAQATKPEKVDDLWKSYMEEDRGNREERGGRQFEMPRPRLPNTDRYQARGGAVIHCLEDDVEEEVGMHSESTLAMVDTPAKSADTSGFFSLEDFEEEDMSELLAMSPGPTKSLTGLPCYNEYNGDCKLGPACPFAGSHGDRTIMEARTKRLVEQVLASKYGGRKLMSEIMTSYQAKQNNRASLSFQDQHKSTFHGGEHRTPRESPGLTLATRAQGTPQTPLSNRPANGDMVRNSNNQGRGGGRLVTFSGRHQTGRAQFTNHVINGDDQEQDTVEEVQEVGQDLSC